jgi:hypothetical protein
MLPGTARSPQRLIGCAVENQQDVLPGKLARQHREEDLEACRVGGRHHQVDGASAVLGRDRAVQVDVFTDELGGDLGPYASRRPALGECDSWGRSFISEHDAQSPPTAGGGLSGSPHSIRNAVFF